MCGIETRSPTHHEHGKWFEWKKHEDDDDDDDDIDGAVEDGDGDVDDDYDDDVDYDTILIILQLMKKRGSLEYAEICSMLTISNI